MITRILLEVGKARKTPFDAAGDKTTGVVRSGPMCN
jgi:hypothetical protein